MHTTPTSTLLISNGGEIACAADAPYPNTGTWFSAGWRPMTKREAEEFTLEVGRAPACETCAAMARNGAAR